MIVRLVWRWCLWLGVVAVTLVSDASWQASARNTTTSTTNATCESTASRWSETNLREVVDAWQFTDEEQWKLLDLKERVADINHWKNDPAELARFIKEHNFDVDKAESMFRSMIDWRRDNDIDTFMERYVEPPALFHYAPIFLLQGLDKDGDPIFVQRIGALDGWGLYQRLGVPAMMDALLFLSEVHTSREVGVREEWQWQKEHYERQMGKRVTQFTIIVDLDGLSAQLLRPALFGILQRSARIAQDHYPGLAKRIILTRGPRIFQMAWKVAVHFYDQRVHDKFIITSKDDYLQVLSQYINLEVLPSVMYPSGGKGSQMPGFFEKIHMEGGPIPDILDDDDEDATTTTTTTTAAAAATAPLLPDLAAASA